MQPHIREYFTLLFALLIQPNAFRNSLSSPKLRRGMSVLWPHLKRQASLIDLFSNASQDAVCEANTNSQIPLTFGPLSMQSSPYLPHSTPSINLPLALRIHLL